MNEEHIGAVKTGDEIVSELIQDMEVEVFGMRGRIKVGATPYIDTANHIILIENGEGFWMAKGIASKKCMDRLQ